MTARTVVLAALLVFACDRGNASAETASALTVVARVGMATTDLREMGVVHDDVRHVTCWYVTHYSGPGLSCIPDWQLQKPETKP